MPSWLLTLGTGFALAQTISGAYIYIKTTQPPANSYVTHCTVIIDEELFGCEGSSNPFKKKCGKNTGTETKEICETASVTVNWDTGDLQFKNDHGDHANCTLSTTNEWGECDTSDANKYPKIQDNHAESLFSVSSALYGLAPVAAGLLI
ncbi:hypothetical protein BDV38DRAFT_191083 [Aspergillus pseudotamarii]|uniref:Uncharacterized protein n=1 Tax=Aspergillus pseudotamarii TaxID=132259 RepID=A0A5N6T5Y2_ASPPS|nr:uncharacterized protein BDV38DRAFT_191083 [Aspergillus pseudotamarii]KAE8141712.1 hypothetical protein BDV38DRAFT_191083 [Aspergillus pseudotamarii]